MQYDNTNTGVLFGNFDGSEPHEDRTPNMTGSVNIEGREYKLAIWVRYGKDTGKMAGKKFGSIKVEPKQPPAQKPVDRGGYDFKAAERRETVNAAPARQPAPDEFDDDIPF